MPFLAQSDLNMSEPGVMELSGRLDADSALTVEEDALLAIRAGARELLLDCADLDAITGAGMQTFLRLAREMKAARGKIAVCNLNPQVREMFDVCGIENMIAVYEDRETAKFALAA